MCYNEWLLKGVVLTIIVTTICHLTPSLGENLPNWALSTYVSTDTGWLPDFLNLVTDATRLLMYMNSPRDQLKLQLL
jgi:hypothetical protein